MNNKDYFEGSKIFYNRKGLPPTALCKACHVKATTKDRQRRKVNNKKLRVL